jgi:hypothetical protein
VSGGESQDVLETLLKVYHLTQNKKYLAPISRALEYLKKSELPDGRLARYYELQSNKPLYMNRDGGEYFLTYDDTKLPDHYGWKVASRLEMIGLRYQDARMLGVTGTVQLMDIDGHRRTLTELDDQGRWISTYGGERIIGQAKFAVGEKYLSSAVFSRNLSALAEYHQMLEFQRKLKR